jgi:hypothetical protein
MGATTMEPKSKKKATTPGAIETGVGVAISVPFAATVKYAQKEIYMSLRGEQAATLRGILEGLENRHAKLATGAQVQTPQDALRWLLDEVARIQA